MLAVKIVLSATLRRVRNVVKNRDVPLVRVVLSRFVAYLISLAVMLTALQESDLLEVVRPQKGRSGDLPSSSQSSLPAVILRRNDFRSSTKLEALVQNLRMQGRYISRDNVLTARQVGSETKIPVSGR
jgi:hypothetical protein